MVDQFNLKQTLKTIFGFDHFRPGQEKILNQLFNHQDTLAILPTGAGKTLIYQMYGLMKHCPVLIISPLISLMNDQKDRMQYLGIKKVVTLNSSMTIEERQSVLESLDQYQFVYTSPEMLSQPDTLRFIQRIRWGLMVIDEAHCVSQWGHDFRPSYLELGTIIEKLGHPLLLMLTATASKFVQNDLLRILKCTEKSVKIVKSSTNRPNIFLSVDSIGNDQQKNERLIQLVQHLKTPGIIYFASRKLADQMAMLLQKNCYVRAAAYHAKLDSGMKYRIQHQFMNDQLDVICATSAFGMGIDKNDVRYVIHYHLPPDLSSYIQEIGRAGRDGEQSVAILLYRPGDEQLPELFAVRNLMNIDELRQLFQNPTQLKQLAEADDDRARLLWYYFQHHYSIDQVNEELQKIYRRKQNDISLIKQYIDTNQCRRNLMLSYFDAPLVEHNDLCCNGMGNPLSLNNLNLSMHHEHLPNHDFNWHLIIERLFNQSWKN